MHKISIKTQKRSEIMDITSLVKDFVESGPISSGLITVYSPHTTAAISVNENYDPDVKKDMLQFLDQLVPQSDHFDHAEGNSDSHIKGGMFNFSQCFIIDQGKIQLGQWQGIYFMEFDGPRNREIWLKLIGA